MLAETIRSIINSGLTSAIELAEIAGISDSAVSRYRNDDGQPTVGTVRSWIRHHPNRQVRLEFAAALLRGSGLHLATTAPDEEESDEDLDPIAATVDALSTFSELSAAVHHSEKTNIEMGEVLRLASSASGHIDRVARAIQARMSERRPARPSRRPPGHAPHTRTPRLATGGA